MFRTERRSHNALLVEMDIDADFRRRFLLLADAHLDNPHCRRDLLKRHLDEAAQHNEGVIILGDLNDLMQGRDDPRRSKETLRPDYLLDYVDAVVDDTVAFLEPYRANLVAMSEGNHESAVRKRLETNVTRRIARALGVEYMPYAGWYQFRFLHGGRGKALYNMYYTHGSGGGGPVTRGVGQTHRRSAMLSNAHIVVSGHIHESWVVWTPQVGITDRGTQYEVEQLQVSTSTYKDEFTASSGYHIERGRPPKPLGGTWLQFRYDGAERERRIRYDAMRA